jgi:hypothetical protein
MLTLVWLFTLAVWAGHVGLLFADSSMLFQLLTGQAPLWLSAAVWAALVPQLFLIPWAWRDSGKRAMSRSTRVVWRVSFFFAGFLATTVYAVRYRHD